MSQVTALEAKTRLGALLDRVARGEEIVITRHERPVARLIPEGRPPLRQVQEAVKELHALRRDMAGRRGIQPFTRGRSERLSKRAGGDRRLVAGSDGLGTRSWRHS